MSLGPHSFSIKYAENDTHDDDGGRCGRGGGGRRVRDRATPAPRGAARARGVRRRPVARARDRRHGLHRLAHGAPPAAGGARGHDRRQPRELVAGEPRTRRASRGRRRERAAPLRRARPVQRGGARGAAQLRPEGRLVHPLRGAQGRRRVDAEAAAVLRQQRRGHGQPAPGDAAPQNTQDCVLVVRDGVRLGGRADHRGLTRGRGDHKRLRPEQVRDRGDPGRHRTLARRLGLGNLRAALFQPRRRAPEWRDRRGPERPAEQPDAVRLAGRRRPAAVPECVRQRLRHARRHGRARLHPRHGPRDRPPHGPRCACRRRREWAGGRGRKRAGGTGRLPSSAGWRASERAYRARSCRRCARPGDRRGA